MQVAASLSIKTIEFAVNVFFFPLLVSRCWMSDSILLACNVQMIKSRNEKNFILGWKEGRANWPDVP